MLANFPREILANWRITLAKTGEMLANFPQEILDNWTTFPAKTGEMLANFPRAKTRSEAILPGVVRKELRIRGVDRYQSGHSQSPQGLPGLVVRKGLRVWGEKEIH